LRSGPGPHGKRASRAACKTLCVDGEACDVGHKGLRAWTVYSKSSFFEVRFLIRSTVALVKPYASNMAA
jgi:hypothetical protein